MTNLKISASGEISKFRFSKTILWPDGTSELVQLGYDGFFTLNGARRRLIGFCLGTGALNGELWSPENIALMDKEYAYLQRYGVRLIHLNLGWGFWVWPKDYPERIRAVLDVAYNHKMLVFVLLNDHNGDGFDCSIDREIVTGRTYSQWFDDFWSIAGVYPNIVTISLENEIDADNRFTAEQIQPYMTWLCNMIKNETRLPVNTKLVPYFGSMEGNERKKVILNVTDVPCVDPYASTVEYMNSRCSNWVSFLTENGKRDIGWWVGETNKATKEGPGWEVDAPNYTIDYLEAVFNNGASIAMLYVMNYPSKPTWAFFDANGDPIPALQNMAPEFEVLQIMP
jgi:hypothetical protein